MLESDIIVSNNYRVKKMIRPNNKIKNICMLSTHGYFDPVPELGKTDTGGQVLYVLQLAQAITRLGINVDIYTRWFDPAKPQIETIPDCSKARVIRIPAGKWEFIPKESIYGILDELAKNMIEFIKEQKLEYDLFHGHYVDAGIVTLKVAKALSKPSFFTAHSLGAWKRERVNGNPKEMDKIFNFTHRIAQELRIFQSVNGQTITSKEEEEKMKELYHFQPANLEFTPPGVDVNKFRTLKKNEKEENTEIILPNKYIFVVSRISKAKAHDLLLPAFKQILKEFPDIHLVIAGGTLNPDQEEIEVISNIKSFVKQNQIEKNVLLIGGIAHDNLPPYFRKAELFILPAKYEPFGMTALEAMACKIPVIISKFSGIQENLTHGQNCLIVNPYETQNYAKSISILLKDKKMRQHLAKKGYSIVREKFSWEAIAKKFINFYTKVIHKTNIH